MGTRQAGFGDLRLARLSDLKLIELARKEAQALFAEDPALQKPEQRPLAEWLAESAPATPSRNAAPNHSPEDAATAGAGDVS